MSDGTHGEAHGPRYAAGVIEARLGRSALDVLEAAVVLEAWGGLRASRALSLGSRVVPPRPPRWMPGRLTTQESGHRESIRTEAIALILAILAVASWAGPLGRQVGTSVLEQAILIALPLTFAIQWAIRSRYLSRRAGLLWLAQDRLALGVAALLCVEVPLMLLGASGRLAGMFVAIWVSGTVVARRGWALPYGLVLLGTVIAMQLGAPAYPLLGTLTVIMVVAAIVAVWSARAVSKEPPGRVGRAAWAGAMGAALGLLLVLDSSLSWGVRGAFPALALLPSVLGSFWGGYHLWKLYDVIPRGLQGVPLQRANARDLRGPAMTVFVGSLVRLLGTTIVLSGVVILVAHWTSGSDHLSLFVAFGCVALVTLLVTLLESFSYVALALFAAAASVVGEVAVSEWGFVSFHVPGAALIVGATVGILIALPPLVRLLSHPGRVLATSLWIK